MFGRLAMGFANVRASRYGIRSCSGVSLWDSLMFGRLAMEFANVRAGTRVLTATESMLTAVVAVVVVVRGERRAVSVHLRGARRRLSREGQIGLNWKFAQAGPRAGALRVGLPSPRLRHIFLYKCAGVVTVCLPKYYKQKRRII